MPTYIFTAKIPNLIVKKYNYVYKKMQKIAQFDENKEFRTDNPKLFLILRKRFPYKIIGGKDYGKMLYNDLVTLAAKRGIKSITRKKDWIIKRLEEVDARDNVNKKRAGKVSGS